MGLLSWGAYDLSLKDENHLYRQTLNVTLEVSQIISPISHYDFHNSSVGKWEYKALFHTAEALRALYSLSPSHTSTFFKAKSFLSTPVHPKLCC